MNTGSIFKIAVVGEQCSGKTSAANWISRHFVYPKIVKFAQPLYDALEVFHMNKHREFMQKLSTLVKSCTHQMIFNDLFQSRVQGYELENKWDAFICDDVRFPFEMTLLRKMGFRMIGINATEEVRRQRAENLGLQFITNHESEQYALDCVKSSDFMIIDEGMNLAQLQVAVSNILQDHFDIPLLLE